jgi:hypothetical protein
MRRIPLWLGIASLMFAAGRVASADASPATKPVQGNLNSVAALASNDVWAVGQLRPEGSPFLALARHWDGTSWSDVPAEEPYGEFDSVAASGPNDVWFGGLYYDDFEPHSLLEHWDGSTISESTLDPNSRAHPVTSISALSSTDAWLTTGEGIGDGSASIVEHWDGTSWQIVQTATLHPPHTFTGITAISATDVWLVGYIGCRSYTLAEHWDGQKWSIVRTSNPDNNSNSLLALSVNSTNDIWAVGETGGGEGCGGGHGDKLDRQLLTEHWDGTTWSAILPGIKGGHLNAVTGASPDNGWAVGIKPPGWYYGGIGVVLQRNGSTWTRIHSPQPLRSALDLDLLSVDATGPADAWAAGYSEKNDGQVTYPWLQHWDGTRWRHVTWPT